MSQNVKDRVSLVDEGVSSHSDFDWPALGPDPMSERSADNLEIREIFAETYDFSNYQLDLSSEQIQQELEAAVEAITETPVEITPDTVTAAQAATGTTDGDTLKQKLHSPLFGQPSPLLTLNSELTKKPVDNGLGMRGGILMVLLDNAIVFAIVCFAAVLLMFAYKIYQKTDTSKEQLHARQVQEKVKAAAMKEDYESIHKQLAQLISTGESDLVERQQALFDEAAFRLGQKELAASNAAKAVDYLKQISVDSDHYVRAREMIFQFATPSQDNQSAVLEVPRTPRRRQAQTNETAVQSRPISENQVLSIPELPELENLSTAENNKEDAAEPAEAQVTEGRQKVSVRKFSESEISQYNRQLAEYFARHSKRTKDEPLDAPSFREWIKQGKPAF